MGVGTAGSATAFVAAYEEHRQHEITAAKECLERAAETCAAAHRRCSTRMLLGESTSVPDAILSFAEKERPDLLIVGSRGLGAFKRSVMGLIGLGSTSEALVHRLEVPVGVVRADSDTEAGAPSASASATSPTAASPPRKIVLTVEGSEHSVQALKFACRLLQPADELHIVSVALPVPLPFVDDPLLAPAMDLQTEQWSDERARSAQDAERVCREFIDMAVSFGVPKSQIFFKGLVPEGGASDVAGSIVHYAAANRASVVVCGSRGLGSLSRTLLDLVGLGSVSSYLTHHMQTTPVIVVKHPKLAAEPAGRSDAAVHEENIDKSPLGSDLAGPRGGTGTAHASGPGHAVHVHSE